MRFLADFVGVSVLVKDGCVQPAPSIDFSYDSRFRFSKCSREFDQISVIITICMIF